MAKIKKIYKYINVLIKVCPWCEGRCIDPVWGGRCLSCNGTGGQWQNQKKIVGEEVTDG